MGVELDRDLKYVVACSCGPDSMCLLDQMIKEKFSLVVAHVNYHKRIDSDAEETLLRKYCQRHNVPIFVLDSSKLKHSGNFQAWARKVRYQFFKDILEQNECDAVAVAHQQDDLLETYLMQKAKKSFVSYYGIQKETVLDGVKIVRPLLDKSKKELEQYDVENLVPYSIDWTNLTGLYTRNKYRHDIVERMSIEDREKLLLEINQKNAELHKYKNIEFDKNIWELHEFLQQNPDILLLQISHNIQKVSCFKRLSIKWIESVQKAFASDHPNIESKVTRNISLFKSYDAVYLIDKSMFESYSYPVDKPGEYHFRYLDLEIGDDALDRNISTDDYPLTIRPASSHDDYQINDYKVKIRRLYMDWKMPVYLRSWWPAVFNKDGKIIYIPRYRVKYSDNHRTKFVPIFPHF